MLRLKHRCKIRDLKVHTEQKCRTGDISHSVSGVGQATQVTSVLLVPSFPSYKDGLAECMGRGTREQRELVGSLENKKKGRGMILLNLTTIWQLIKMKGTS